jgi:hypothetical protein
VERSLRTVGTGRGSGSVRLIARTQCDDLSLLNRICDEAVRFVERDNPLKPNVVISDVFPARMERIELKGDG